MSLANIVSIMLCVNDPSNGNYCGRLAGLSIDDLCQLEPMVLTRLGIVVTISV